MNNYEGVFILDSVPSPDAAKKAVSRVSDTITKEGGSITKTDEWGKRRLAYLIGKSYEGYYLLLQFKLSPDKMARVRSLYQLDESLLRYMIVVHDPKASLKPRRKKTENGEEETPVANETAQANIG